VSEIELAASLQQANIVPLLTVGETDGLPYYTMPFVDGLSLRARLERNGALPVGEAISLLRDVVRALAYAHDHGVVHRNIKREHPPLG
jgi:serine/threonine-protein kinase